VIRVPTGVNKPARPRGEACCPRPPIIRSESIEQWRSHAEHVQGLLGVARGALELGERPDVLPLRVVAIGRHALVSLDQLVDEVGRPARPGQVASTRAP
jgi:hypothetical protein